MKHIITHHNLGQCSVSWSRGLLIYENVQPFVKIVKIQAIGWKETVYCTYLNTAFVLAHIKAHKSTWSFDWDYL